MNQDSNLSLIYSQLAILSKFESKTSTKILEDVNKKYNISIITNEQKNDIELRLKPLLDMLHPNNDGSNESTEVLDKIKSLFIIETNENNKNNKRLNDLITKIQLLTKENDQMNSDNHNYTLKLKELPNKINETQDICRKLQNISIEKNQLSIKIKEEEILKTNNISIESAKSLTDFQTKLNNEENEIINIENDNNSLKLKLNDFNLHLTYQKEKLQKDLHTKDLMKQLKEAKFQHKKYLNETHHNKVSKIKSHISQSNETINHLTTQNQLYIEKFMEFSSTLEKSSPYILKLKEQENYLINQYNIKEKEKNDIERKKKQEEINLITSITKYNDLIDEIKLLKEKYQDNQLICRQLQNKRKEILSKTNNK